MKQTRASKKLKSSQPGPAVLPRVPGGPADWTVRSQLRPNSKRLAMQSSDCASSCFPAGTLVTMADGSQRPIETVQIGDWVLGLSGAVQVWAKRVPILGRRPLLRFADGSLHWSAEHTFWVKRGAQQWLGSHDTDELAYEISIGVLVGLTKGKLWDLRSGGEWYAHASGWIKQRAQGAPAPQNLELYYLKTTGCHTLMVNGYVVSGGIDDTDFDYGSAHWTGAPALVGTTELI